MNAQRILERLRYSVRGSSRKLKPLSLHDLAKALGIAPLGAEKAVALLEKQGQVERIHIDKKTFVRLSEGVPKSPPSLPRRAVEAIAMQAPTSTAEARSAMQTIRDVKTVMRLKELTEHQRAMAAMALLDNALNRTE